MSASTAGPLATLAGNAGEAGTQLGTVADASERIGAATGVPEAITATAEAAVAAAPGVGQLAEQSTAVASAVETVAATGKELPATLEQWGAGAEALAGQLQPLNEGTLGEHRQVVADIATAYRDTVTAQQEVGTQIATLTGQLTTLQEQFDETNKALDRGIEKHREYDRSLEETGKKLDELKQRTGDTHQALADLVDPEVLGQLIQLDSTLGSIASSLAAVEQNALAAARALAQVPQ